jgi:hypothetical protein
VNPPWDPWRDFAGAVHEAAKTERTRDWKALEVAVLFSQRSQLRVLIYYGVHKPPPRMKKLSTIHIGMQLVSVWLRV